MQDLVEALASYTQRHFVRMDRLVRSTFLLDYTLASMNVLMPDIGTDSVGAPGLEAPWADADVDASTGTDVDTDAFMQPAIDIQADADTQAILAEQHQEPQAETESTELAGQLEGEGQMQEEVQAQQDEPQQTQQQAQQKSKDAKKVASKRRKSVPQPVSSRVAEAKVGAQTAVKVKRKKTG